MPFYEYQCTECGKVTEVLQKISDPPVSSCSSCSGKMKKLISQSTFHLKGSGWYVTDYTNNSGRCNAKSTGTSSDSTQNDKKQSASYQASKQLLTDNEHELNIQTHQQQF